MPLAPSKLDSNANKAYSLQYCLYLMLKSNLHERSQVLTDMLLKMEVFQDVTLCSYASLSSCFEGSQCIHLQSQAL